MGTTDHPESRRGVLGRVSRTVFAGFFVFAPCPGWAGTSWIPFRHAAETRQLRDQLGEIDASLAALPDPRIAAQAHQRLGFHGRAGDPAVITLDLGQTVRPDSVVLFPARITDPAPDDPVGGFPPEITISLSADGADGTFAPLASWREPEPDSGRDLPLLRLRGNDVSGRFLRLEVRGSRARAAGRFFTLGEIVVLEGGVNRALGAGVSTGPSIETPPRWSKANLTDGYLWFGLLSGVARSPMNGFHSAISPAPDEVPQWVEVDLGEAFPLDEIRLVPARPADYADVAGFGFPPDFSVIGFPDAGDDSPVTLFDSGPAPFPNPGEATVSLPGQGQVARRIRVVAHSLWRRSDDYIFALAELQAYSGGRNVALGQPVRASGVVPSGSWSPEALVDGSSSQRELLDWPVWLDGVEERIRMERVRDRTESDLDVAEAAWQRSLRRTLATALAGTVLAAGLTLLALQAHQARERNRLRHRIARDLHDEVGSQLSHLALLAEQGHRQSGATEESRRCLAQVADTARDLQHTMRDLVWLLEPAGGDARDLTARIRATCQRMLGTTIPDLRITVTGVPPSSPLPLEWSRDVLLFVKEAAANAARHSRARSAEVHLVWETDAFRFELRDEGTGFDETCPAFNPGAGLRNLRLRAEALGGTCVIESRPDHGTRVMLRVPRKPKR